MIVAPFHINVCMDFPVERTMRSDPATEPGHHGQRQGTASIEQRGQRPRTFNIQQQLFEQPSIRIIEQ